MDLLKKFLAEKKLNKSFKKAGSGHVLSAGLPNAPSIQAGSMQQGQASHNAPVIDRVASADAAAQAAFKRLNLGTKAESITQRNIRLRATKELEDERRVRESETRREPIEEAAGGPDETDVREFDHSNVIDGVYFSCELLGDDLKLKKSEMKEAIEGFLVSQLDTDALVASSLMLFSLNSFDARTIASETLQKYVKNILENVDDQKFRRIRFNNKAFQERVVAAKGGREFLQACGFEMRMERLNDSSDPEPFLVMPESKASDLASLVQAIDLLQAGQPVPLKLHRNPAIYHVQPNRALATPYIPKEFFDLSAAEIKKEQTTKTAQLEKLLSLRTREMRERDELLRNFKYKYTLIRIRFPNDYFIQGTFAVHEKFANVREFLLEYIAKVGVPLFILRDPAKGVLADDEKTIGDLGLMPAAVIHFEWDSDVLSHLSGSSSKIPYLAECHLAEAEEF